MEEWKLLFNNYEVSNMGQVRNGLKQILKQREDKDGYYKIGLDYKPPEKGIRYRKTYIVSRLVGQLFILNPNNLPQIHHIDNNVKNNCVSNLMWVTSSKNNCLKPKKKGTFTSKYVGVVYYPTNKSKWRALLFHKGKYVYDKCWDTEENAIRARNQIIIDLHLEEYFIIQ
jgi:hypothetical protein